MSTVIAQFLLGVCSDRFCADLLLGDYSFDTFSFKYGSTEALWAVQLKGKEVSIWCVLGEKMIYAPFGCTTTIGIIAFLTMKNEKHEAWSQALPVQEKGDNTQF